MSRPLRHGYTTGACAAAAALGAALMLRQQGLVDAVELPLPAGFSARFVLHGQRFQEQEAACFVIKDAGDDPDVTHGVEVHAAVRLSPLAEGTPPLFKGGLGGVEIVGGVGIGRVTKKGLAVPVGEWAINPVPRRMIAEAIRSVFPTGTMQVALSIPDGEQRALRTLNARLGILGGLSILGSSGVVRPISHKAWTDTLDVAMEVALAAGAGTLVLSTGRTSELVAQDALALPEEAFIMMGDHVGYALEACHRKGVAGLVLAGQFAKLVKIACGHEQTHVRSSTLELKELAGWMRTAGLDGGSVETIECANTAREVYEGAADPAPLAEMVALRVLQRMRAKAPGAAVAVLVAGYDGRPAGRFGEWPQGPGRNE